LVRPSINLAAFNPAAEPEVGLHAKSALLVDGDSLKVLWTREPKLRRAPASLTKLMTAAVALDYADLDTQVKVTGAAATAEPSRMGLEAGETLTVRDLLYGMLLPSGNDAAEALASGIIPRPDFIAAMNHKAADIGMRDSHFSTPSGLDAPGLYTTAYDLAILAAYIVRTYPFIVQAAPTRQYSIPGSELHKAYSLTNGNHLLAIYPGATGLKPGFTDEAGLCIVATATRGNRHLLAVLMGSDIVYGDAVRFLDYGFST